MNTIIFDFDDTLINTANHCISCYNRITSDTISVNDFICEFTWDNLFTYKTLWRELIAAVVNDPTAIPPIKGSIEFLNGMFSSENEIFILSKRYGKSIIKNYLKENGIKQIFLDKIRYILVSENEEKSKFIKQIKYTTLLDKIFYFEDRADVVEMCIDDCYQIFVYNRPWNLRLRNLKSSNKIIFYSDFNEIKERCK